LLFEDRNGNAQLVTTSALVALFELFAGKICCVVLNACYAEVQAKAISAHVPYVIGMSEAISDQAAVEFAAAFYDALGSGQKIELAFKAACVQLQLLNIPEDQIPVLKRGMPPLPPPSEPIQHPLPEGSLDPHLVVIPAGILSIEQSGVSIPIKKFAMGRYLITFEEFDKFCVLCNKDKPSDQGSGRGKQPVVNVSCQSAREYCEWLSFQTGKHYRLPTSEEWLYVAKEGFRDLSRPRSNLNNYIWHRHNSGNKPHPVRKNKPNRLGVYDVLGNIWEWVALPHSDSREIASGGCYRMDLNNLIKYPQQNADAGHLIGFRVVVELG